MPFDTFALAAVLDEVRSVKGGQIQRIIQPSPASIGFGIYAAGSQRWLLVSADAQLARLHFVEGRLAKAFPTPGRFVMLLRKYLEGARVVDAEQLPHERVLLVSCRGRFPTRVVAEIMGRHSNILLVDEMNCVLGALKIVTPRQSRVRPVLAGASYVLPPGRERDSGLYPPGPRVDPATHGVEAAELLARVTPGTPARGALLGLLPGCGPFLAEQIALRAGLSADEALTGGEATVLVTAARELYTLLDTRRWEPSVFRGQRGKLDYAPYRPVHAELLDQPGTMSLAIERAVGHVETRDSLGPARNDLLRRIDRARRAVNGRVQSLSSGLQAAADAEQCMTEGQLILAYQHGAEPGSDRLDIPDLGVSVPLDPSLSIRDNAEKRFRRYRKLRDAALRIPALLQRAEAEAERLNDLASFARLADSESALRDLERDLTPDASAGRPAKPRAPARSGPLRFRLGGFTAIVGRNASENEAVTFREASRNDTWLHARGRTGAHVVLRGAAPPDEVVEAAAALAAHFSEGRADNAVDVDIASVRDVRKISGGPPGRVTYRNERTVRVAPGMGDWEPVRRD